MSQRTIKKRRASHAVIAALRDEVPPKPDKAPKKEVREKGAKQTVRRLNVPLLICSLVALSIAAPSLYFWRSYQVNRLAGAFLTRADALEEEKKWKEAAGFIHNYLQLRPDDHQAQVRLARVYDKAPSEHRTNQRAIDLYYAALGVADEQDALELRRRLASLLLDGNRLAEAASEAEEILKQVPDDGEGLRVRGWSLYLQYQRGSLGTTRDIQDVGEAIEKAFQKNQHEPALALTLARILRQESELLPPRFRSQAQSADALANQATAVIQQMVAAGKDDPLCYVASFQYKREFQLPGAEADLRKALQIAPKNGDVLLTAAQWAFAEAEKTTGDQKTVNAKLEEAEVYYQRILKDVNPQSEVAYVGLGAVYVARNEQQKAIKTWREGMEKVGFDSLPLAGRVAELLLQQNRIQEAEEAIEKFDEILSDMQIRLEDKSRRSLEQTASHLQGVLLFAKDKPLEALPYLEVAASGENEPEKLQQSYLALMLAGRACEATGQWDRAAFHYNRAVQLQPNDLASRTALAQAWMQAGQPNLAIEQYAKTLRRLRVDPAKVSALNRQTQRFIAQVRFQLAEAQLQYQLSLPFADRNWQSFTSALEDARSWAKQAETIELWRYGMMEIDAQLAREEELTDPASKTRIRETVFANLQKIEKQFSSDPKVLSVLAIAYERADKRGHADRVVDRMSLLNSGESNGVDPQLLRARILTMRDRFDEASKLLNSTSPSTTSNKIDWLRALAAVNLAKGDNSGARRCLRSIHEIQNRPNLRLIRQLAELAIEDGDFQDAQKWEQKLRELEGPSGCVWRYCQGTRLLVQIGKTKTIANREEIIRGVENYAQYIGRRRPSWPESSLLLAMTESVQGRDDRALEAYRNAIRLGARRIGVYEQMYRLLLKMNRLAEAEKVISVLFERGRATPDIERLESFRLFRQGDQTNAVEIARKSAAQNRDDPLAQIWYGQVLNSSKQPAKAEEVLLQAKANWPKDVRVWNGLFSFYLRTKRTKEARQTLNDMVARVELEQAEKDFVLAQGLNLLGEREESREAFERALGAAKESIPILLHYAGFQLREGEIDQAEQTLERIRKLDENVGEANRALAALLAAKGTNEAFQRAMSLLGRDSNPVDQRLRAMLLTLRKTNDKDEKLADLDLAQQIMESLVSATQNARPADRLLLARILERQYRLLGDSTTKEIKLRDALDHYSSTARDSDDLEHHGLLIDFLLRHRRKKEALTHLEQLKRRLTKEKNPRPSHLAQYVDLRLRLNQPDEAASFLSKLEEQDKDSLLTMTLKIRWLDQKRRTDEIRTIVEPFAQNKLKDLKTDDQRADLYLKIGQLYALVRDYRAAENWHRKRESLRPDEYEPLAITLARQKKIQDAVDICFSQPAQADSTKQSTILASVLSLDNSDSPIAKKYESRLTNAIAENPEDTDLIFAVAGLRVTQGRLAEARQLYERVLQKNPDHVMALNNLATILSESDQGRDQALTLIDRAIDLSGPHPALYDTKGMILVLGEKPQQAVDLLELATRTSNPDPRYHFHLALAYYKAGEMEKAKTELQLAKDRNLLGEILTPSDRKLLSEMQTQFE